MSQPGLVDVVAVAYGRTDLAKRVGFRDRTYAVDATYFEDILLSCPDLLPVKLPHILFMHN